MSGSIQHLAPQRELLRVPLSMLLYKMFMQFYATGHPSWRGDGTLSGLVLEVQACLLLGLYLSEFSLRRFAFIFSIIVPLLGLQIGPF